MSDRPTRPCHVTCPRPRDSLTDRDSEYTPTRTFCRRRECTHSPVVTPRIPLGVFSCGRHETPGACATATARRGRVDDRSTRHTGAFDEKRDAGTRTATRDDGGRGAVDRRATSDVRDARGVGAGSGARDGARRGLSTRGRAGWAGDAGDARDD